MIPGDIADVPTLACLNKSQKRALILRDQLRYLEPAHLDTFLDGMTADEPPTYRHVNGTVWPPLAQISIKQDATRFDLGNVQFPDEGGKILRVYFTVEDERFEMRTEDPLPKDDDELASVAIHRFVAENMLPLFQTKYKAIHARMEKINEARRVAYNMLDHPPAKFEEGETLARLHSLKPKAIEDFSRDASSRKRKEIVKHVSNKRQRVGLETIPDAVKSETFNTIPAQVKVDLFNNIIKTAFPNFDNLIVASWNVVSVYANVGSDFPELHKAVVELKGALEEFESAYVPPRTKSGKNKKDTTPNQSGSRTATPVPTTAREARSMPVPAGRSSVTATNQPEGDKTTDDHNHDVDDGNPQHQMLPPRLLQKSQRHTDEQVKDAVQQPDSQAPTPTDRTALRAHSIPRHAPEDLHAHLSSPDTHPSHHPREHTRNPRNPSVDPPPSHTAAPGSELLRKRQQYASSITKANRSSTGAALGHAHAEVSLRAGGDDDERCEDAHRADGLHERRVAGAALGGAFQAGPGPGAKKGGAPVAPMMHVRKDGGMGGGGGGGAARRGY